MGEPHGRRDDADTVIVVLGGGAVSAPPPHHRIGLVVAADSGFDEARRIGLEPDILVGDLDSISPAGLAAARDAGVRLEAHPSDKDLTDAALALTSAAGSGLPCLVVLGGDTVDRLDHLLGAISALGDPDLAVFRMITAHLGATTIHVLHPGRALALDLSPGRVFSLVAAHGPCRAVRVDGARWPLDGAELLPGSTRGISNEAGDQGHPIAVSVGAGVLTVVVPPHHVAHLERKDIR